MKRVGSLLAALLVVAALAAGPALADGPEIVTYTVQSGDSVWSIAEEFYGDGRKYPLIYRYNSFSGKPPHLLEPGRELRLPVGEIGPEAVVRWIQRDVQAKPPRSIDWLPARPEMNLWRLYKVATGDESAAQIVFEDTSQLRLRESALLVIYGATSRKARTTRRDKTRVVLEKGTLRSALARLEGQTAPLTVETPAAEIELQGPVAQIEADEETSRLSVYEGSARMSNARGAVEVPEGHGSVVDKGRAPRPPRRLPPPPAWTTTSTEAVLVVPDGQRGRFEAAWRPVSEASRYRVELSRDEAFQQTLIDLEVGAAVTRLATPGLEAGEFWARVSALDADRLEGRPSPAVRVRVVRPIASRALVPGEGGAFDVVGMVRLALPEAVTADVQVAVGDGPFRPAAEPIRLVEVGLHPVRYRAGDGPESRLDVHVRPARAALQAPAEVAPDEESFDVAVTVEDDRGLPAALPGLTLAAAPGGALPLTAQAPGRYTAQVPVPAGYARVDLRLTWAAGLLADESVAIAHPPAPDAARYVFEWAPTPLAPRWDRASQATPMAATRPLDRLGVAATYLDHERDGGAAQVLALSLEGELALADDRLGLDLGATLLRPEIASDRPRRSELGDVRLGGRYRLLTDPIDLAAGLRLRAPLDPDAADPTELGIEPGVLARIPLTGGLALDTRHALVVGLDFGADTSLVYAGTWALSWRPLELLGLTAFFDTSVPVSTTPAVPDGVALAAGGGVQLHLGRLRLALIAGFGLNDAGRQALGAASVGLALDVGYGGP